MKCPECERDNFTSLYGLSNHMRRFHPGKYRAPDDVQTKAKDAMSAEIVDVPADSSSSSLAADPGALICPDCGKGPFKDIRGMMNHRRILHKIATVSQKSAVSKPSKKPHVKANQLVTKPEETINGYTTSRTLSQAEEHFDPRITAEFVAYTVGKIEGLVERIASENDLPARQFARRCAEYFQLSANR